MDNAGFGRLIFGTPEFRGWYAKCLKSTHWKRVSVEALKRANKRCEGIYRGQRCPCMPKRLTIHHRHYRTLGHESLADVAALCPECHRRADRQREIENQEAYEEAGEAARLENMKASYFATKYGDDADDQIMAGPEGADREFEAWREKKGQQDEDEEFY